MKDKIFLMIVDEQFEHRKKILSDPKKKRTAGSSDRLLQFKRMAAMRKCTIKSAAIDLCTKQFTDLLDMADETHPKFDDLDYMKELVADVQNYLDIMIAIAVESEV